MKKAMMRTTTNWIASIGDSRKPKKAEDQPSTAPSPGRGTLLIRVTVGKAEIFLTNEPKLPGFEIMGWARGKKIAWILGSSVFPFWKEKTRILRGSSYHTVTNRGKELWPMIWQ
jgi:hypothetical protein